MRPIASRLPTWRRTFVALAALAAVALALPAVRRHARGGGVALDVLRPTVARALGEALGTPVDVGSVRLEWSRRRPRLALVVHDLRVGRSGPSLAVAPAVMIGLHARMLLRGRLAPAGVVLVEPTLRIARGPGTGLAVAMGGGADLPAADALARGLALAGGTLEVRRGRVALVDRARDGVWRARDVQAAFATGPAGPHGRITARLQLGVAPAPLRVDTTLAPAGALAVAATLGDVDLAALPLPASVPPLRGRAILRLDTTVGADGTLAPVAVLAKARGATLRLPAGTGQTLPLDEVVAAARVDVATRTADRVRVALRAGETTAYASGRVSPDAVWGRLSLALVPAALVWSAWRVDAAADVRRLLVTHVTRGRVRRADARFEGVLGDAAALRALQVGIVFDGVDVTLPAGLPPARGVSGTADVDLTAWDVRMTRGRLGALAVVRARARPSGPGGAVAVDATLEGALADLLAASARWVPPEAATLGVTPAQVGGRATITLGFTLRDADPAVRDLRVSVQTREARVQRLLDRWPLDDGRLTAIIAGERITLDGAACLAGTPVTLHASEDRSRGAAERRRVEVRGAPDAAGRAALGYDTRPWLEGPADLALRWSEPARGPTGVVLDADLRAAVLALPALGISKIGGEPGRLHVEGTATGGVLGAITAAELSAGGSSVRGSARRATTGTWSTADVQLALAPQRPGDAPGHLRLTLRPGGAATRVTVTSDDAGALFRALGGFADAEGGALVFQGTAAPERPGFPVDGQVDVRRFTLTRAPALARIATLASLSGLRAALDGGGIAFDGMVAHLRHQDGLVTIADAHLGGRMLGVDADATIDRRREQVEARLTVVPALWGLNRAVADVPVLGRVLGGTRGEGVVAVDATLSGPLHDPRVQVRPLSSVAPGVLRDLTRLLRR